MNVCDDQQIQNGQEIELDYSIEEPKLNDLSSIMGSFVNLGRPSDMNEDRIISKEAQETILMQQHIGKYNKPEEMLQNKSTISGIMMQQDTSNNDISAIKVYDDNAQ